MNFKSHIKTAILLLSMLFFLVYCSSENEDVEEESDSIISVQEDISLKEIIKDLDKANFPQEWDPYLKDDDPKTHIWVSAESFEELNLIDDTFY